MIENINVIRVNEEDEVIGELEKMQAHYDGILHRAFSIFIFNSNKELLLQQRASNKYHSGNLWTNTCCSHPLLNENIKKSAEKRLIEEMNIICNLKFLFKFIYNEKIDNKFIEHELDYVFIGFTDLKPKINLNEVQNYRYISKENLLLEINKYPNNFTKWFKICINKYFDKIFNF